MKKLMIGLPALAMCCYANAFTVQLRHVADGDTVMVTVRQLPAPLNYMGIRLRGIDTPELKAKCAAEKQKALMAKAYLISLIGNKKNMKLTNFKHDRIGGRIDANISIDGIDLSQAMIAAGYAVKYEGVGQRQDWCAP